MERKLEQKFVNRRGLAGSTLKLIAITAMLIDHVGAIIAERMIRGGLSQDPEGLYQCYLVLRFIGRLGFPLFCFLLVEGFRYTRDKRKYAGRLLGFAMLSEIPFDLGFAGEAFYWQYQNVFFTLFLGFVVMMFLEWIEMKNTWPAMVRLLLEAAVIVSGMGCGYLLKTDYSEMGVLTIAVFYLFRHWRVVAAGAGCTVLTYMNAMEITAFGILLPVWLYDGRRGWKMKWGFYLFYPAHILLLYLVACGLGLGDISLR